MRTTDFAGQIDTLRQLIEDLYRQAQAASAQPEGVRREVVDEQRAAALEKLHVVLEEMHQQNRELAAAREAVEAERQRYQELFDFAPDGYLVTDVQGVIRQANRAAAILLNVPQHTLTGKPLLPFIAEAERQTFSTRLHQLLQAGWAEEWEVWLQPQDREPFAAGLTLSTLMIAAEPGGAGNGVSVRWLLRDITRRKRAEEALHQTHAELEERLERTTTLSRANEELRREIRERQRAEAELAQRTAELQRSNEELQQFSYVVSHDLQEPLRMVASYVQRLAKRYLGRLDAEAEESIGYAVEGATRMQALIRDLLVYTRVGSQGQAFGAVDCEAVLAHTVQDLQLAIAESGAEVTHDPLPTVRGDVAQLRLVFQNLIGNALKFRGPAPLRVHVSARPAGWQWTFSVRDNGIGLDPRQRERIFQVFQRLHTRGQYPGTGIGLAICKKIVEQHGGRIWVESEPEKGATFFCTLPALA